MRKGRFFFASNLTDRSSVWRLPLTAKQTLNKLPFVLSLSKDLLAFPGTAAPYAFSPGNFFADFLDRTVIY